MPGVVEITGLRKSYGDVVAVADVSLEVAAGSVFGLLGPNGAGKTTILGCLLGLVRPDAGAISLLGRRLDDAATVDEVVRGVGSTMETPSFYPYMSGRDNLRYFQGIIGESEPAEVDRLLELVGLAARADTRFQTYSLGMKHRLGVAFALLGDPKLLLLDEPTNGLDPAGMAEVRGLIRRLGEGDRTIVLASHLLNEVEQVCDSVGILSKGRLIATGAVRELIGRRDRVRLRTTDDGRAAALVGRLDWVDSVVAAGDGLVVGAPTERAADLSEALAGAGIYVAELTALDASLEEYFLEVTGDLSIEGEAPA